MLWNASHDYILHMDVDTIYQPKTLKRKLRFLKDLDLTVYIVNLCYAMILRKTIIYTKIILDMNQLFPYKDYGKRWF